MIIIADSGSTKTDWCVVNHGKQVKRITTEGTNPFFQTEEEISQVVKDKLMPHLDGVKIDAVYFYGAGCAFPEKNEIVHNAIYRHIPVTIEVGSDLLAAFADMKRVSPVSWGPDRTLVITMAKRSQTTYPHWDISWATKAAALFWENYWSATV